MYIKKPIISEIALDTYLINEFGLSSIYFLNGKERGLLIDTGCGICDLKALIQTLTDKPYDIVLTHGHMDHVGGIGCFESVYVNEKDLAMTKECKREEIISYARMLGEAGSFEIYDYDPNNVMETKKLPEFQMLKDGDGFELGDRYVQAFEIEGHTDGGMVFLDWKNRIVFSGDCCNMHLLAQNSSVERTLKALKKFKKLEKHFDRNYNGHAGYMGNPDTFSQPKSVTNDLIYICESILKGKAEPKPYLFLGRELKQMSYGSANLSYNPNHLKNE